MKKLILILALLSVTSYAKTRTGYVYTPKNNKNFFSLMLGFGPAGIRYETEYLGRNRDEGSVISVKNNYSPLFGAQYTRMFNSTFGGSLGFMSNNSAFAATTIGW